MTARTTITALARAGATLIPDALLSRLMPGAFGWDNTALRVSERPDGRVRLLIAPVNSAGQAYRWARAAEGCLPDVGAANLMVTTPGSARFAFPADVLVPQGAFVFAHGWQKRQQRAVLQGFTHVLLESGRFLFGSEPFATPDSVVRRAVADGVQVALLWHGSDIRVPSEHAAWEADSPFGPRGQYPPTAQQTLETNARAHRAMVEASDLPVFVSTPGMLAVPRSQWLPVVVDPQQWETEAAPLQRAVPVVAYVPSNSPMKGDPSVDTALAAMAQEGLIEYRRLEGIPAREMPGVYRDADIVLDQFRLGDYGVAACEAMAAGRVVIGHVHDDVRRIVRDRTGLDLPIREARFDEVGDVVRAVLADRAEAQALAAAGPAFVRAVHDGRASAGVLAPFLGASVPPTSEAS